MYFFFKLCIYSSNKNYVYYIKSLSYFIGTKYGMDSPVIMEDYQMKKKY